MNYHLFIHTYIKEHRLTILMGTICSIVNQVCDLLPELLMGVAVDTVINQKTSYVARWGFYSLQSQLLILGIAALIIWTLETIFQYAYFHLWRMIAQSIQKKIRIDCYEHLQTMDGSFFEKHSTGELVALIHEDINQIERFFNTEINNIIQLTTNTITTGAIFFYTSPTIALLTLLPTPCIGIMTFLFQEKLEKLHHNLRKQSSMLAHVLTNNLLGIMTIKIFNTEMYELQNIIKITSNYTRSQQKITNTFAAFRPIIRLCISFGFTTTIIIGGWYTAQGIIPIGAYSSLIFLTQRLLWPCTEIGETINEYQRIKSCFHRLFTLLSHKKSILSGPKWLDITKTKGQITFKNVTFAYQPDINVIQNFSCDIKEKTTTAFVGKTGSGKSSIIKLLLRLHDPQQGEIYIDDHTIKDLNIHSLRNNITVVSQEPFLFHGSIYHNLTYGVPNCTLSEVQHACTLVNLDEFINNNPEKYQMCVGEQGKKISGGQKQRIAIARALLKKTPILIFDEATSAIDTETEEVIQKILNNLATSHTIIIIAHRLTTITHAATIHILDNGTIVESGTHDELIIKNGHYKKLWLAQNYTIN